jgi:uncharacterized phage protein (TIGR01671 family)
MMINFKFRVWDKKNSRFLKYWDDNTSLDLWRWAELMSTCLTFPINDYIIQQYTGLKDSCGVEIYEGDIIEWKTEREPVTFDNGVFWADLPNEVYLYEVNRWCKVVGHINGI